MKVSCSSFCSALFTLLVCCGWLAVHTVGQQPTSSEPGPPETATQDVQIPAPVPTESLPAPIFPGPLNDIEPLPIIDQNVTGWNGSLVGTNRLGSEIRANWLMIDPSGGLRGSVGGSDVSDVAGMEVIILRDGLVKGQTITDNSGAFALTRLTPGLYTIVGYGPRAFFAFGFNAIAHRPAGGGIPRSISVQAQSAPNKMRTADLVVDYSPEVRFRPYGNYSIGEDDLANAKNFGWLGLANFDFKATPATTLKSRPIPIGPDGRFSGRVHQIHNLDGRPVPILDTRVQIIEQGLVVAEAGCDRYGVFEFSNFVPGDFGLVAFGGDGFAAFEIQLRAAIGERSAQTGANSVDLSLIQPESIGWLNNFVRERGYLEIMDQPRVSPQRSCPFCVMQTHIGVPVLEVSPGGCTCRH